MKIPALTSSGGFEHVGSKKILEYRVWIHPKKGGDSYYYRSKTYKEIVALQASSFDEGRVEIPLGVIRDEQSPHGYREVCLT